MLSSCPRGSPRPASQDTAPPAALTVQRLGRRSPADTAALATYMPFVTTASGSQWAPASHAHAGRGDRE